MIFKKFYISVTLCLYFCLQISSAHPHVENVISIPEAVLTFQRFFFQSLPNNCGFRDTLYTSCIYSRHLIFVSCVQLVTTFGAS